MGAIHRHVVVSSFEARYGASGERWKLKGEMGGLAVVCSKISHHAQAACEIYQS